VSEELRTLDLAGGPAPREWEGALPYGVDSDGPLRLAQSVVPEPGVYRCDIAVEGFPFPDNFFCRVFAQDVLRRVPKVLYAPWPELPGRRFQTGWPRRRYAILELFNEVWRVLEPGGVLEAVTPIAADVLAGDPTTASAWCVNSFNYLAPAGPENFEWDLMRNHGYRARWRKVALELRHGGSHLYVELMAVKER
jgi:hypothetical protein